MASILTNTAAMKALREFRKYDKKTQETNTRIASGAKIRSGKENAAYFSASTTTSSDASKLKAIHEAMTLNKNAATVSRITSERFKDLALKIQEQVAFAQNVSPENAGAGRDKIQQTIDGLVRDLRATLDVSSFNGDSFIGAGTSQVVTGIARTGATTSTVTTVTFPNVDLEAIYTNLASVDVNIVGDLQPLLASVESMTESAIDAATRMGITEKTIEEYQDLLTPLSDIINSGAMSLIEADMEEEAARLAANQAGKQLATTGLSISGPKSDNLMLLLRNG